MKRDKALFIVCHPFLPPIENGVSQRFIALKKYLDPEKYEITFVNNSISNLDTIQNSQSYLKTPLQKLKKFYHLLPLQNVFVSSFFKNVHYILKALSGFLWLYKNLKLTKKLISSSVDTYENVILFTSYSPLESSLLGMTLKKKFKNHIFWISDHRDEMTQNKYLPCLAKLHLKIYEKNILARADLCTVVSIGQKEHYCSLYPHIPKNCAIYMNGFDFLTPESMKQPTTKNKLRIIYAGSMYEDIQALIFFEAFKKLNENEKKFFEVFFIGNIPFSYLPKNLSDQFTFSPDWMTYMDCINQIQSSDIGLLIDPPSERKGVFPIKLSDYIGSGITTLSLSAPQTYSSQVIMEGNAGYVARHDSVDDVVDKLRQILLDWKNSDLRRPAPSYSESFSRKNRVLELQRTLDSALKNKELS